MSFTCVTYDPGMTICVVNGSKHVNDSDFHQMVGAVASQLWWHAAPAWGLKPVLMRAVTAANQAAAGDTVIIVMDTPDQAGALGYHTEDPGGKRWGRVFVQPVLDNHGTVLQGPLTVASVLSHEGMEALVDPGCCFWAQAASGSYYALEVGDAVENDSYRVTPAGQPSTDVSNFCLPAWFDAQASPTAKFDWMGKIKAPFTLDAGGYAVTQTPGGAPQQIFGELYPEWRKPGKLEGPARTAKRLGLA